MGALPLGRQRAPHSGYRKYPQHEDTGAYAEVAGSALAPLCPHSLVGQALSLTVTVSRNPQHPRVVFSQQPKAGVGVSLLRGHRACEEWNMIPTLQTWGDLSSIPHMGAESMGKPSPQPCAQQGAVSAGGHGTAIISFARLLPSGLPGTPILQMPCNFLHSRPALPGSQQVSLRKPSQPRSIAAPLSPTLAVKEETPDRPCPTVPPFSPEKPRGWSWSWSLSLCSEPPHSTHPANGRWG